MAEEAFDKFYNNKPLESPRSEDEKQMAKRCVECSVVLTSSFALGCPWFTQGNDRTKLWQMKNSFLRRNYGLQTIAKNCNKAKR